MPILSCLFIALTAVALPEGDAPDALALPHFPDRLHAFVWRNWQLVPPERMAETVGATPEQILALGRSMGLDGPPLISETQWRRSYISIIRRNWHLLPYDQLLTLLDWTAEEMAYTLREDDFLFVKLGNLKPRCAPLRYDEPDNAAKERAAQIKRLMQETFPERVAVPEEPLFHFVEELSEAPQDIAEDSRTASAFDPRYCYSYFALYGDPFLDPETNPYPDGYLARLKRSGVNGVWLQGVLHKLVPFPWEPELSEQHEQRLENLRELVARLGAHGLGLYLYLNEPRSMPLAFFDARPELRGVTEGEYAALCTSVPDVQEYLRAAVAELCRAVPDLAGFFTITASENLTSCWSHHSGAACPRCSQRAPAEVIAEVNTLIRLGMHDADHAGELIAWDWGWRDDWAVEAIDALPRDVAFMSVSEWSIPIQRGGIDSVVGEYSISTIGPGPRATRHWAAARERGLKTLAKIQAGNTWEIAAVPYIPALFNVAEHAARLTEAEVDGLMLGWTLGGYPSPNLEAVNETARGGNVDDVLQRVAERRYGEQAAAVVQAWRVFSDAFSEFPYNIGVVYQAPLQVGPANLVWAEPTGYRATMAGIPYDDIEGWRAVYPVDVFAGQFEKMADGFDAGVEILRDALEASGDDRDALQQELNVAETIAVHFRSVANQARFTDARNRLAAEGSGELLKEIEEMLAEELRLAVRLHAIQSRDLRIGFEATNHYFYVPLDLAEKVLNCRYLLDTWLPARRSAIIE
ncbi:MAG: hypothetical protein WD873_00760 [Candidatus Hydrogenedentales bacterium]